MHFTYLEPEKLFEEGTDLFQGDILALNPKWRDDLDRAGFKMMPELTALLVVSQTCDLVQGRMKADPIACSPVVSLGGLLPKLLNDLAPTKVYAYREERNRKRVSEFLSRLFNQNEASSAYFYLHEDVDMKFGTRSVACLRHKICFSASEYGELQSARVGRLTPEFRSKLGWMVGNIYSRQATSDWKEGELEELKETVLMDLDFISHFAFYRLKKQRNYKELTEAEVREFIHTANTSQTKSEIVEKVLAIARRKLRLDDDQCELLKDGLWLDTSLEALFADAEMRGRLSG